MQLRVRLTLTRFPIETFVPWWTASLYMHVLLLVRMKAIRLAYRNT